VKQKFGEAMESHGLNKWSAKVFSYDLDIEESMMVLLLMSNFVLKGIGRNTRCLILCIIYGLELLHDR
jgi:hypothetical protein